MPLSSNMHQSGTVWQVTNSKRQKNFQHVPQSYGSLPSRGDYLRQ